MTEEKFGFVGTFNMGYEGFSRPLPLQRMHPVYGNKGEWAFLLCLFALVPLVRNARKKNEDALRKEVITTNRYAELPLDAASKQPLKWTL